MVEIGTGLLLLRSDYIRHHRLLVHVQPTTSFVDYLHAVTPFTSCRQRAVRLIQEILTRALALARLQFMVPTDRRFRLLLGLAAPINNELLSLADAILFSSFMVTLTSGMDDCFVAQC